MNVDHEEEKHGRLYGINERQEDEYASLSPPDSVRSREEDHFYRRHMSAVAMCLG